MAYTLTLRPSAPALVRPQRALLKVEGERITDVEYRPDTGDDQPFARVGTQGFGQIVATAARLCPTCGYAHTLALCQAVETLAGLVVPPRAACLRVMAAELERVASHLTTVTALLEALGMERVATTFAEESRTARSALETLSGGVPADWLVPGGVGRDLDRGRQDAIGQVTGASLGRLFPLVDRLIGQRSLLARTVEVGVISKGAAEQFGLQGPLARAAGLTADLRLDAPYAAYADFRPALVTQEGGDVYARLVVLIIEALESLKLVERATRELPAGEWREALPTTLPTGTAEAQVEAPRGPLRYGIEAANGRLVAINAQAAPQLDRLLARAALVNATVDDVALIVVSTDPCDGCLATRGEAL